ADALEGAMPRNWSPLRPWLSASSSIRSLRSTRCGGEVAPGLLGDGDEGAPLRLGSFSGLGNFALTTAFSSRHVSGPIIPSTCRFFLLWKDLTAASVCGPNGNP